MSMMSILNRVLSAEEGYFKNGVTREYLIGFLKQAKKEYEVVRCQESGREDMRCKVALLFILRRIKHKIMLENRLMDIVDSEAMFVVENMRHLLFETMRINPGSTEGFNLVHNLETNRSTRPRTRANFPMDISQLLRSWLKENMDNPYPSDAEKAYLCQKTGLGPAQINNWFINARRRILPFMKGKYVNFQ